MVIPTNSPDIVCLGEAVIDFVAADAETLADAQQFQLFPGGAPANVAVAAARLGATTALVGLLGDDPFGELLRTTLTTYDVDTRAVKTVPQRTTMAFVAKNRGGIPDFVFYRGSDAALRVDDVPADLINGSRLLYLGSMALMSEPSRGATYHAVDLAYAGTTLVAVDPNLRPSSWRTLEFALETIRPLLARAHVLKVNEEEARLFSGHDHLDQAIRALPGDLALVTRGADGCLWRLQNVMGEVRGIPVEVADTTGAGDAFMGALLFRLNREISARSDRRNPANARTALLQIPPAEIEDIITFACAASAFSCTTTGAMSGLPNQDDVKRTLSTARRESNSGST